LLKEQLIYIIPLGFSVIIFNFNNDISKVIISANLGASALAIYAIGSQNIPLINIIVTSVTNTIFPEMAQKATTNPLDSLSLWNKSNLLYLFLMLPVFFIFFFYAEEFITTLFTAQYSDAVILFRIYLLVMLRKCFEMSTPLRAMNKNKYFIVGNLISLLVNVVMLFLLFKMLGFIGPAIAYVVTEFSSLIYLSVKIISTYNIKLSEMLLWKKSAIVLLVGTGCLPILFVGNFFTINPVITAVIFSTIYIVIYLLIMRKLKIDEVDIFMNKILKGVRLSW
jgi:O-antigen/teichoic acid export membrane protein